MVDLNGLRVSPGSAAHLAARASDDRCGLDDKAAGAGLAWSPTLVPTFHAPERSGWIEFVGETPRADR